MKRLFSVLIAAALCFPVGASAWWQSIQQKGGGSSFTPSCTASSNFLARATGITLTADKTNYDTLICGLNTDGVLAKLDALYVTASPDAATARLNLLSSSLGSTEHGTVTFSAYPGFTGDGSTGYEDTGFVPPSAGGNYTQNSASYGGYVLNNPPGDNGVAIGCFDGSSTLADTLTRQAGGSSIIRVNTGTAISYVNATRAGMYVNSRTTNSLQTAYKNGVSVGTDTNASAAITSLPSFFILARNDAGTPSSFSFEQISAAFIGGGLSSTDASNLTSRINAFMTAYGINVF